MYSTAYLFHFLSTFCIPQPLYTPTFYIPQSSLFNCLSIPLPLYLLYSTTSIYTPLPLCSPSFYIPQPYLFHCLSSVYSTTSHHLLNYNTSLYPYPTYLCTVCLSITPTLSTPYLCLPPHSIPLSLYSTIPRSSSISILYTSIPLSI